MEAHGGFPGYYPVIATLVFYPWSALVPAAILGAWLRRKSNPELGFLLGWVLGPLLLLECFQTKLIHYYLPAFPACALLLAWLVLTASAEGGTIRRQALGRLGLAILVGVGLAVTGVLVAAAARGPASLRGPMIVIAVILVSGTLLGTRSFRQGASEPAVYALAATWTLVLLVFGGWLVPLAEPYRTSRVVGQRLASLSARLGLKPVLLEYQEPGVIYAVGHPVALTRDQEGFFAHLRNGRSVLTVALPSEIAVMRSHFGLEVTPVDQVEGFVLTKGKHQVLQIAVVRQAGSRSPGGFPFAATARSRPLEQTDVK
jgi:4-amino-4-deoxy-L-arabinose transferase-like glycosyltransferase